MGSGGARRWAALQAAQVLLLLLWQGQASILLRLPPSSSSSSTCSSALSRYQCYARLRVMRWLKASRRLVLMAMAYSAAAVFLLQRIQQVGGWLCGWILCM